MTPRAWLVDLDGTLYRPTPVKIAMGLALALAPARTREHVLVFRREHEHVRRTLQEPVESPYRVQIEWAAQRLDITTEQLRATVTEWMIERPGRWIAAFRRSALLREIDAHRARGGRTALVSDYPARDKLRALGVEDRFDVVVANGETGGPGRLKPHPDGVLMAAEELGVPPEACLVIGDRRDTDGAAAERAGMAFRHVR